jgi:hypothetical protein
MARNNLIQFRKGTASAWTSANPILASGELGFETDTGRIKIGNGSTAWTSLTYSPQGNLDANARVGVRKNSTGSTFLRRRINLIEGSNITLTVADDSTNEEVDITIAGATPGAVATDVLWDAKGDLAAGTGANTAAKLTVGANEKILKADSTQTTGLIWADIDGGSA